MGKRLTQEEREARIKAYEEAKAARAAERLEKRKARIQAYEEAKAKRERAKKGMRPAKAAENSKVSYVNNLPPFKGKLDIGDEVGFRFLGMAFSGKITNYTDEIDYHDSNLEEGVQPRRSRVEFYTIKENSDGTFYPVKKNDIFCKKIGGVWMDKS